MSFSAIKPGPCPTMLCIIFFRCDMLASIFHEAVSYLFTLGTYNDSIMAGLDKKLSRPAHKTVVLGASADRLAGLVKGFIGGSWQTASTLAVIFTPLCEAIRLAVPVCISRRNRRHYFRWPDRRWAIAQPLRSFATARCSWRYLHTALSHSTIKIVECANRHSGSG